MPLTRSLLIGGLAAFVLAGEAPAPAHGKPASTPAVQLPSKQAAAPPAKLAKAQKATPQQRAEAERLEPLARAAFWAREVDVDPKDGEARLKLARALRAMGKYPEAVSAAEQLLVMQPDNVEALLESARDRLANNEGFYAIEPAERAQTLAPRDWRPVSLLAIAYEQTERDDDALAAHLKALSLAPDNPATLSNLGMYYASHGDPTRAEALLRQAVGEPGATALERQNLALVLGMEGRLGDSERLARRDLPPEVVDNNLSYLRAANSDAEPAGRTWDSLKSVQ